MEVINMNESFCEHILQTHQKNKNIQVLEIRKNLATTKGDNYLSEIYRIFVKYNKSANSHEKNIEETSLIVKLKLSDPGSGSNAIDEAFRNESKMFRNVLPRIEKDIGCSVAPFLYYGDENSNYIVMEDLGKLGYVVADKSKGLSFDQCLKVIEKMAKFHAGSVAIAEKEQHLIKPYDGVSGFETFPETFYKFLEVSLIKISNSIAEQWKEEEYLEIAYKLKKLSKEIKTRILTAFEHEADEFCVLNHGDFWINNVMLQHNQEGKPCDARIVDFQLISYTSPAIDLQHFFAMCPELEVKGDKDEYLLETYLTVLTNTMRKIGCKTNPPTIEHLKEAMRKRGTYSILTGLIYYPRVLAAKKDVESFTDVMETGETKMDVFKNPMAAKIIRKFCKIVSDKGYLD